MSEELNSSDHLTALQIYTDLIKSCRQAQKDRYRVHFNTETGVQKIYLDGKLMHIKHVRYTPPPDYV
jgi:hypothetical protein